jgi:DNA-binding LacI/PurR family transcriptional regulator
MARPARPSSLRSVAETAGVAIGTASRALQGDPTVNAALRARVVATAAALGYQMAQRRRKLRGALLVEFIGQSAGWHASPMVQSTMAGITAMAAAHGFGVTQRFNPTSTPGDPQDAITYAGRILGGKGSLIVEHLATTAIPTTVLCSGYTFAGFDCIGMDDVASGRLATEWLLRQGHRRIAFVNNLGASPSGHNRCTGWRLALRQHHVDDAGLLIESDEAVIQTANPSLAPPPLYHAVSQFCRLSPAPTAVLVANDWGAAGFLKALHALPAEQRPSVSVMGFDHVVVPLPAGLPSLASMQMPFQDSGALAAWTVIQRLQTPARVRIPTATHLLPGIPVGGASVRPLLGA